MQYSRLEQASALVHAGNSDHLGLCNRLAIVGSPQVRNCARAAKVSNILTYCPPDA
jgi:hypothetical protein